MFFQERIKSIKPKDLVLEIGPGATPYYRSDIFLELEYATLEERIAQSGRVGILNTNKKVVYYKGNKFPFHNNEFDYVVCSHVLEHVADPELFLKEIFRVGKKGYLEFPTIYYDYLYNFPEHKLFLLYKNGLIKWMAKKDSGLNKFSSIQEFFNITCELKYYDTIESFKEYFFQGFEWFEEIRCIEVSNIKELTFDSNEIDLPINFLDEEKAKRFYPYVSFKKFFIYKIKKATNKFLKIT